MPLIVYQRICFISFCIFTNYPTLLIWDYVAIDQRLTFNILFRASQWSLLQILFVMLLFSYFYSASILASVSLIKLYPYHNINKNKTSTEGSKFRQLPFSISTPVYRVIPAHIILSTGTPDLIVIVGKRRPAKGAFKVCKEIADVACACEQTTGSIDGYYLISGPPYSPILSWMPQLCGSDSDTHVWWWSRTALRGGGPELIPNWQCTACARALSKVACSLAPAVCCDVSTSTPPPLPLMARTGIEVERLRKASAETACHLIVTFETISVNLSVNWTPHRG